MSGAEVILKNLSAAAVGLFKHSYVKTNAADKLRVHV